MAACLAAYVFGYRGQGVLKNLLNLGNFGTSTLGLSFGGGL